MTLPDLVGLVDALVKLREVSSRTARASASQRKELTTAVSSEADMMGMC